MTVKELIEILNAVEDKNKEVVVSSNCSKIEYVNIIGRMDLGSSLEIIIEELE